MGVDLDGPTEQHYQQVLALSACVASAAAAGLVQGWPMESPGIAPAPAYAMEPPQKSGALKRRPGTQWVFYVCRLPMSEPEIRGFMAQAEGLLSVDVLTDDAGYPTGFGYAQYRTPDLCARAIEALSGTEIASSITIQLRPSPGPPAARAAKVLTHRRRRLCSVVAGGGGGAPEKGLYTENRPPILSLFCNFHFSPRRNILMRPGGSATGPGL